MNTKKNIQPLLQAKQLRKSFAISKKEKVEVIRGIDMEIFPGETVGLVGESGSGKSTLGRLLLRLIDPDSGHVFFESKDVTACKGKQLQSFRKQVQIIFQDPFGSLNPKLTVNSMLEEVLKLHGEAAPENMKERVFELLDTVGIRKEMVHRYPHEFSGGQRQRLVIARALAVNPKMIVADEAVSALDVSVQAQILNLLLELQEKRDLAMIFISHDLAVVRHMSHRVLVLHQGEIVEEIAPEKLHQASHPYTKRLFASAAVTRNLYQRDSVA